MYKNVLLHVCQKWKRELQKGVFPYGEMEKLNYQQLIDMTVQWAENATVFNLGTINTKSFFIKDCLTYLRDEKTNGIHQSEFLNQCLNRKHCLNQKHYQLPHSPIMLEFSMDALEVTKQSLNPAEIKDHSKAELDELLNLTKGIKIHSIVLAVECKKQIHLKSFYSLFTTSGKYPTEKIMNPGLYSSMPPFNIVIAPNQPLHLTVPSYIKGAELEKLKFWADLQTISIYSFLQFMRLMHCKNVTTEIVPIAELSKKQQIQVNNRNRLPSEEYRILKIVLPKHNESIKFTDTTQQSKIPIDIRRGHFKTFTEERPLFGKVHGTYWWQPIAKSDKVEYQVSTKQR